MPKLRQPLQRLDQSVELVHSAHAHRLAVGWLVAREAGINPQLPLGGQGLMEKWDRAKNLPSMLKAFQPQAKFFYRVRALCLQLHNHPFAQVCGGAEQWWQHVLDEDILNAVAHHLGPRVFEGYGDVPVPKQATVIWWLRRGINPINPDRRPASWALIEATQARCFPDRIELLDPADDVALPIAALNGQLSLHQRKSLLRDLTGSIDGWKPNHRIELTADWALTLNAWQATAKEEPKKQKFAKASVDQIQQYEQLAPVLYDVLFPSWWANISAIRSGLSQICEERPSAAKAFGSAQKIQPQSLLSAANTDRLNPANKKDPRAQRQPAPESKFANYTSKDDFALLSNSNPEESEP